MCWPVWCGRAFDAHLHTGWPAAGHYAVQGCVKFTQFGLILAMPAWSRRLIISCFGQLAPRSDGLDNIPASGSGVQHSSTDRYRWRPRKGCMCMPLSRIPRNENRPCRRPLAEFATVAYCDRAGALCNQILKRPSQMIRGDPLTFRFPGSSMRPDERRHPPAIPHEPHQRSLGPPVVRQRRAGRPATERERRQPSFDMQGHVPVHMDPL